VKAVLISTYDLGRQPFGLASPAAWLRARGHSVVCADLSRTPLPRDEVRAAGLVAFHLPMHTATRLALRAAAAVRALNPRARLCAYGLYAPMNEELLRSNGFDSIVGGEFEQVLADLADGASGGSFVPLGRLRFLPPDRDGLPPLSRYASLRWKGEDRAVGYTEASRGCKHLCRHCPIVPVYKGAFRIVPREVVLEDVRRQVAAGARHISFGDPDFFNGPGHALEVAAALHEEHPGLTYDVVIKIEHLLQHARALGRLVSTGCLFVTSAVESVDDAILERLRKGHTRRDFVEAVRITREAGLTLAPTFVAFTPWTTREGYADLLRTVAELDLVENVAPIQLAIRLLIPQGSALLELEEVRALVGPFDPQALSYPWKHPDPEMDALVRALQQRIRIEERKGTPRREIFAKIAPDFHLPARAAIPYMTEPWYC
jgi:radical SAM superfamily enzyme YgiQ (UPF0313 family)